MTICKWCKRPLEGDTHHACNGGFICGPRMFHSEGEEQGRAKERAEVVAWLRSIPWRPTWIPDELAERIERGEHLPKVKP